MNYKFFLNSLKNVIFDPAKHWETIDSGKTPDRLIRNSFFLPLIILVSISAFFGSLFFSNSELSLSYSILTGIKNIFQLALTVYATAFIYSEITYPLDLGKDFNVSFKIILFSLTPLLLCQLLSNLFDSLLFVDIIGLYGLYIMWTGAEKLLAPPQYKKMPLLIAATLVLGVIYVGSYLLLSVITDKVYYAFFA